MAVLWEAAGWVASCALMGPAPGDRLLQWPLARLFRNPCVARRQRFFNRLMIFRWVLTRSRCSERWEICMVPKRTNSGTPDATPLRLRTALQLFGLRYTNQPTGRAMARMGFHRGFCRLRV